jgi:hypothetical protein
MKETLLTHIIAATSFAVAGGGYVLDRAALK